MWECFSELPHFYGNVFNSFLQTIFKVCDCIGTRCHAPSFRAMRLKIPIVQCFLYYDILCRITHILNTGS